MARRKKMGSDPSNTSGKGHRKATTPEGREAQLCALAMDLAEQQIRDGTASSQVITHFLKITSSNEKMKRDNLQAENELLKAKVEALQTTKHNEQMYDKVLEAIRSYTGTDTK